MLDYHVMGVEECPRCKQFEDDHMFRNCGFTVVRKSKDIVLQEFKCSRCEFKWERLHEVSLDYRPAFRRETRQLELFEVY